MPTNLVKGEGYNNPCHPLSQRSELNCDLSLSSDSVRMASASCQFRFKRVMWRIVSYQSHIISITERIKNRLSQSSKVHQTPLSFPSSTSLPGPALPTNLWPHRGSFGRRLVDLVHLGTSPAWPRRPPWHRPREGAAAHDTVYAGSPIWWTEPVYDAVAGWIENIEIAVSWGSPGIWSSYGNGRVLTCMICLIHVPSGNQTWIAGKSTVCTCVFLINTSISRDLNLPRLVTGGYACNSNFASGF